MVRVARAALNARADFASMGIVAMPLVRVRVKRVQRAKKAVVTMANADSLPPGKIPKMNVLDCAMALGRVLRRCYSQTEALARVARNAIRGIA